MARIFYRDDDVGISPRSRWENLIHLTKLLYEGKVELEELVSQSKCQDPLDHGFLTKRKRSPRNNIRRNLNYPRVDHPENKEAILENPFMKMAIQESPSEKPIKNERKIFRKTKRNPSFRNPSSPCKRRKCFESSSSSKILLMSQHIINSNNNVLNLQLHLSDALKTRIVQMGGCLESVAFIIQKGLYSTDVNESHGRLSVPVRQVRERFLLPNEVELLGSDGRMPTVLIQPCLEDCEITFRAWSSNSTYVLMSGWNGVVDKNKLKEGTVIRLWAFRINSKLCFALELVR